MADWGCSLSTKGAESHRACQRDSTCGRLFLFEVSVNQDGYYGSSVFLMVDKDPVLKDSQKFVCIFLLYITSNQSIMILFSLTHFLFVCLCTEFWSTSGPQLYLTLQWTACTLSPLISSLPGCGNPLWLDTGLDLLVWRRWGCYTHGVILYSVLIKRPASEEGGSECERWTMGWGTSALTSTKTDGRFHGIF